MSIPKLIQLAEVRELAGNGEARRIRRAANLSMGEVARVIGVSVPTILRWETGEHRPSGQAALRWGVLLNALASAPPEVIAVTVQPLLPVSPVSVVLGRLDLVRKSGKGWMARCPAHEDRTPSLSVSEGDDGRVL
jgi:DNA-binding transcriptional regulator YiaG